MNKFEIGETVLVNVICNVISSRDFDSKRTTREVVIVRMEPECGLVTYIILPWFECWQINEEHCREYSVDPKYIGEQGYYIYESSLSGSNSIVYTKKYLELNSTPTLCIRCKEPFIYVDKDYTCSSCLFSRSKEENIYSPSVISSVFGV